MSDPDSLSTRLLKLALTMPEGHLRLGLCDAAGIATGPGYPPAPVDMTEVEDIRTALAQAALSRHQRSARRHEMYLVMKLDEVLEYAAQLVTPPDLPRPTSSAHPPAPAQAAPPASGES